MAARSEGRSRWYKIESVGLGNKTELHDADEVGVVMSFTPTAAADAVPNSDLVEIAKRLDVGWHGENVQAKDWAGNVVAEVMNLDPKRDKMKIGVLLKTWIGNGSLKVVNEHDEVRRKDRPFVKGGIVIPDFSSTKARRAAKAGGEANDLTIMTARAPAEGAGEPNAGASPKQPTEAEAPPESPTAADAGIPFMMTRDMRRRLNARGFTDEQIDEMTPASAWQILAVAGEQLHFAHLRTLR
jgi:hypothetical protein